MVLLFCALGLGLGDGKEEAEEEASLWSSLPGAVDTEALA